MENITHKIKMADIVELSARFDSAKSFYNKAHTAQAFGAVWLWSYDTLICCVSDGVLYRLTDCKDAESNTTQRHIREFARQNNAHNIPENVREWRKMDTCPIWQYDAVGDHTRAVTFQEMKNYTDAAGFFRSLGGKEYRRNGIYYVQDPSGHLAHKVAWYWAI